MWRETNPEGHAEIRDREYAADPEPILARNRERRRREAERGGPSRTVRRRRADPEGVRAYARAYYARNRHAINARRRELRRRRRGAAGGA